MTDKPDAKIDVLLNRAQGKGVPEFSVPRRIFRVDAVPILGSGKIDYPAAEQIAAGA